MSGPIPNSSVLMVRGSATISYPPSCGPATCRQAADLNVQRAINYWEEEAQKLPGDCHSGCRRELKHHAREVIGYLDELNKRDPSGQTLAVGSRVLVDRLNLGVREICQKDLTGENLSVIDKKIADLQKPLPWNFSPEEELKTCLNKDPSIFKISFFKEKEIVRKVADSFGDSQKSAMGLELDLERVIAEKRLHPSEAFATKLIFKRALEKCATKNSEGLKQDN